ncbi:MAG: PDZ domain-containing protein, partial [Nitrospirota bacterium]|nr:PDZ domain-containing protein [Nitrospirota bacterium]
TAGQQDSSGRFSTVNAFTWPAAAQAALPEPAPDKAFYQEGHWIGLETVALTPSFAAANNIKPGIEGVLVDEVTLLSAETGVMAGDVIVGIGGNRVRDLAEFLIATKMVKDAGDAMITVYRNGGYLDINVHAPDSLGFAQMEAAPMITPGATSPHGYYGQCDDCHAIATNTAALNSAHLGKDLGDTFAPPPPITRSSDMPHRYRGVCQNCHIIRGDVK